MKHKTTAMKVLIVVIVSPNIGFLNSKKFIIIV